jgi:hypothetical protein
MNEILGECYPEEKINEFLNIFNKIFLSFRNVKFKENYEPIEFYSHKIYDNFNYRRISYIHDLNFAPFSYKYAKGLLSKKEYIHLCLMKIKPVQSMMLKITNY